MKCIIRTKTADKCEKAIKKFALEVERTYNEELKKPQFRPIRKYLPDITPFVYKEKDKVVFAIPLKLPDFERLTALISKVTSKKPKPKWKEKLRKYLEQYLNSTGIGYESIEVVG